MLTEDIMQRQMVLCRHTGLDALPFLEKKYPASNEEERKVDAEKCRTFLCWDACHVDSALRCTTPLGSYSSCGKQGVKLRSRA